MPDKSNNRKILDAIREQTQNCIGLQELASSNKVSFEDSQKIRKVQDKEYKKLQWMKKLSTAMEKQYRNGGDDNDRNAKESNKVRKSS